MIGSGAPTIGNKPSTIEIFTNIGIDAASRYFPSEFRTPQRSVTRDIKKRYGKEIRAKSTTKSIFFGSCKNPGASINTKAGISISNILTINSRDQNKKLKISLKKIFASFLLDSFLENIGIKDIFSAPSAIILLKIFGNFRAIKKASAILPAPNVAAISISLINPSNLLMSVIPETRNNGLIIFIKLSYGFSSIEDNNILFINKSFSGV